MDAEIDLVGRARSGDRAAFEELVRRTTRLVYGRVYLETGDRELSEDLVQETFLRAFRSMGQVTDPAGFRRWLVAIAQSVVIDNWRRASRKRRTAPVQSSEEPAAPIENIDQIEARDKVRAILQSLPEEYRLPLTLRYLDGAECGSITLQLGLSPGSLRGLLYRGLQVLRRAVKSSEVFHEPR